MKRYNVLWLDDEPEINPTFIDRAELDGIDLIHVYTVKEFKEEFTKNIKLLDAVVLDGMGVIESRAESATLEAIKNALAIVAEKKHIKSLSPFILSGYLGKDEYRKVREMLNGEKIYIKSQDEVQLILDLKAAANLQNETQIKHDNEIFFDAIKIFDIEIHSLFIDILSAIRKGGVLDDKLYFTQIRMVLEQMFREANKAGLLHDKCINKGRVNLSDSSLFLSGELTRYSDGVHSSKSYFPKLISDSVKKIVLTTGAASHTTDPEFENNLNVQEYRKSIQTPYLLYSLTFQLMDILIWFKNFIDQNPDPEENKKLWREVAEENEENEENEEKEEKEELNWIEGKVIKLDSNDFAFFQPNGAKKDSENSYIHKSNVVKYNLTDGLEIKATSVHFQDSKGETKPQVKNIQIIEK